MNKPHKHAAIIKAWADGAEIQVRRYDGPWMDIPNPTWNAEFYRIKPEKKPDLTMLASSITISEARQIRCTFDGETGKLKKVELI